MSGFMDGLEVLKRQARAAEMEQRELETLRSENERLRAELETMRRDKEVADVLSSARKTALDHVARELTEANRWRLP